MARKSKSRRERDLLGSLVDAADELAKQRRHEVQVACLPDRIEIRPDTFLRTVWYVQLDDERDVVGWMYRVPGSPWNVAYRFKYPDRKVVYRIETPPEPDEGMLLEIEDALTTMLQAACKAEIEAGGTAEYERLDIQLVGAEALECIMDQPWAKQHSSCP